MMIKVIYFMYRKPGWAVEEFQDYWRSTHGDLVRKIPDIRCYTQCHTLLSGYGRPAPPPADGIEELNDCGLTEDCVVLLLHDATKVPKGQIRKVLEAAPLLAERYVRPEEA